MDILKIILILTVLVIITFIVGHFWIFIVDSILAVLKRLFHIQKKEKMNWHPIVDSDKQSNEEK